MSKRVMPTEFCSYQNMLIMLRERHLGKSKYREARDRQEYM
jgi:hypothetical protein